MKETLRGIPINIVERGIKLIGSADGSISDLTIDQELINIDRKEELEDLLVLIFEKFQSEANKKQAEETQNSVGSMLPFDLNDLGL